MNATDLIKGISLLISGAAYHDDGFIAVGAASHSEAVDGPEIDLSTSVFEVEAGLEYDQA